MKGARKQADVGGTASQPAGVFEILAAFPGSREIFARGSRGETLFRATCSEDFFAYLARDGAWERFEAMVKDYAAGGTGAPRTPSPQSLVQASREWESEAEPCWPAYLTAPAIES